jgi:hypothetical protein
METHLASRGLTIHLKSISILMTLTALTTQTNMPFGWIR